MLILSYLDSGPWEITMFLIKETEKEGNVEKRRMGKGEEKDFNKEGEFKCLSQSSQYGLNEWENEQMSETEEREQFP